MPLKVRRYHRQWTIPGAIFSCVLLAGFAAAMVLVREEPLRVVLSNILSPLINAWAFACLVLAALHFKRTSPRQAAAWGMLAAAQLLYVAGDITWSIFEIVLQKPPFPSIADVFYLAYYPAFLTGVFLFPSQIKQHDFKAWLNQAVDLVIVLLSAVVLFWVILLAPMLASLADTPLYLRLITLAYPVGDLLLVYALLVIFYHRTYSCRTKSLAVLAASIGVMIIVDTLYGFQYFSDTFVSGNWLDVGWVFTYLLTALAGLLALQEQADPNLLETPEEAEDVTCRKKFRFVLNNMPFMWVVLSYALLVFFHQMEDTLGFFLLAGVVGIIIVLVLFRQMLAMRENDSLLRNLRITLDSLRRRSEELSTTNLDLKGEIQERERMEVQLFHDATHDTLTGLANRTLFMDRLEQIIIKARRFPDHLYSVLFLDIDLFKVVNDSLGHTAGDQLLIQMANRLSGYLRMIDTVARFGGDEFLILLEELQSHDDVIEILARLQEEIKRPFVIGAQEVHLSSSIGLVIDVSKYERAEDVIRDADIAMYHAKETGKSRYQLFSPLLRALASERMDIEKRLRSALKEKEFSLVFQPVVRHVDGVIVSLEALIRWQDPDRGLVSPGYFIPIAEQSGLICEIDQWVLEEACRQAKLWQLAFPGADVPVHVNISGREFSQQTFTEDILSTIRKSGLPPHLLHLEITENVLIENQRKAQDVLSQLRSEGIRILLDDFGKGYSSWSYLSNLSIDIIKIDKMFADRILEDRKHIDIIHAIALLARSLDLEVVAEGVETSEQMALIEPLGIAYIQGYYYYKPMSAAEITLLLFEQNRKAHPL